MKTILERARQFVGDKGLVDDKVRCSRLFDRATSEGVLEILSDYLKAHGEEEVVSEGLCLLRAQEILGGEIFFSERALLIPKVGAIRIRDALFLDVFNVEYVKKQLAAHGVDVFQNDRNGRVWFRL